jgi:hypothetical protein
MSKADLHIHTTYSIDGTASVREALESAARAKLDVIAITDHDEVRGALEARAISTEYGIQVISGAEVSTSEGHLIVLFIERNIPKGMSLINTLITVREMGGIAIVAHPDHPVPSSISLQSILKALDHPQAREALQGIEVCNMNPTHSPFNQRSQKAADSLPLAQIASSDAHIASMIGAGVTHFEGSTVRDLRRAIQRRATQPEQINHEKPLRIFFRWLRLYLRRKANDIFAKRKIAQPISILD